MALAALTFLILYNAVSMRLRDRSDVGSQISDLSRGTADLARQVGEVGRRMTAMEVRLIAADTSGQERIKAISDEIGELASLLNQLAGSIATHEDILANVPSSDAAKTFSLSQAASDTPRAGISAVDRAIQVCRSFEVYRGFQAGRDTNAHPRKRQQRPDAGGGQECH